MKKSCIIVSAGPVSEKQRIPEDFIHCFVIACDAGWKNCKKLGLIPDLVLGDFDSSEAPNQDGVVVLPKEKDDTDTHYAARQAVAKGFDQVLMLGALGGARMEHTLANIGTALWLEQQGVHTTLMNEKSCVSVVLPSEVRTFVRSDYQYISLFPLEGKVEDITLTGAKYPLQHASLDMSYPVGVSNEWDLDKITIQTQKGALLVVETIADR